MMHPRRFLLLAAFAAIAVACSSGGEPSGSATPTSDVSASPIPTGVAAGSEDPSGTDGPSEDPSASESPSDGASEPTDTDRARFAAEYRPADASDLEHVQVDLDGDEVDEIVFAYVRSAEGVGHVDVAAWDPEAGAYAIVAGADGGVADRIDRVRIADLNLDGQIEVALFQERGSSGRSVSLWAVGDARLIPMVARDGCWSGSSTYGVIGASLEDRDGDGAVEIYATCDDSPLPASAWSTDTYTWLDNAWRHTPTTPN